MADYQKPEDMAYAESLIKFASKEAEAFFHLKHTAERKDGVIPPRYRELMSIAVALTTQCAYCIDSHIKNAVEAGATRRWSGARKKPRSRPGVAGKNRRKRAGQSVDS